jgi:hypothetical protein
MQTARCDSQPSRPHDGARHTSPRLRMQNPCIGASLLCVCLLWAVPSALRAQQTAPGSDTVTISGKKNPEQIAQWDAWGFAFRFIATAADSLGDEGVPTPVYRVLTKDERAALVKQVKAAVGEQKACEGRMLQLRERLKTDKVETVVAQSNELRMDCRRATLRARDQLLESIPTAQLALRQFVESQKSGMTVTLRKSEVAAYHIPE